MISVEDEVYKSVVSLNYFVISKQVDRQIISTVHHEIRPLSLGGIFMRLDQLTSAQNMLP